MTAVNEEEKNERAALLKDFLQASSGKNLTVNRQDYIPKKELTLIAGFAFDDHGAETNKPIITEPAHPDKTVITPITPPSKPISV